MVSGLVSQSIRTALTSAHTTSKMLVAKHLRFAIGGYAVMLTAGQQQRDVLVHAKYYVTRAAVQ